MDWIAWTGLDTSIWQAEAVYPRTQASEEGIGLGHLHVRSYRLFIVAEPTFPDQSQTKVYPIGYPRLTSGNPNGYRLTVFCLPDMICPI